MLEQAELNVEVINQPVPGMDKVLHAMGDAITISLLPVVSAIEHKLRMDHDIWERVKTLGEDITSLEKSMSVIAKMKRKVILKNTNSNNNSTNE